MCKLGLVKGGNLAEAASDMELIRSLPRRIPITEDFDMGCARAGLALWLTFVGAGSAFAECVESGRFSSNFGAKLAFPCKICATFTNKIAPTYQKGRWIVTNTCYNALLYDVTNWNDDTGIDGQTSEEQWGPPTADKPFFVPGTIKFVKKSKNPPMGGF
jgi:hypothetical protein